MSISDAEQRSGASVPLGPSAELVNETPGGEAAQTSKAEGPTDQLDVAAPTRSVGVPVVDDPVVIKHEPEDRRPEAAPTQGCHDDHSMGKTSALTIAAEKEPLMVRPLYLQHCSTCRPTTALMFVLTSGFCDVTRGYDDGSIH